MPTALVVRPRGQSHPSPVPPRLRHRLWRGWGTERSPVEQLHPLPLRRLQAGPALGLAQGQGEVQHAPRGQEGVRAGPEQVAQEPAVEGRGLRPEVRVVEDDVIVSEAAASRRGRGRRRGSASLPTPFLGEDDCVKAVHDVDGEGPRQGRRRTGNRRLLRRPVPSCPRPLPFPLPGRPLPLPPLRSLLVQREDLAQDGGGIAVLGAQLLGRVDAGARDARRRSCRRDGPSGAAVGQVEAEVERVAEVSIAEGEVGGRRGGRLGHSSGGWG